MDCEFFDGSKDDAITIATLCGETYPCTHAVYENQKYIGNMNGVQIANLLQERHQAIPDHFRCYIGKHFNPGGIFSHGKKCSDA